MVCVYWGNNSVVGMMRMKGPRLVLFLPLALLILQGRGFELQDTIHALIEENIHLHDQLENLTQALRELKQLLWHHSNDPNHEHDEDIQHLWDEWSEHGISAETHLLLERALCGHDAHGSASPLHVHPPLFDNAPLYHCPPAGSFVGYIDWFRLAVIIGWTMSTGLLAICKGTYW